MKVGVVSVQGAVSEHLEIVSRTIAEIGEKGKVIQVRRSEEVEGVDALILPGGESTTISKLLVKFRLFDKIKERVEQGMPLMGTCAGMILLAKEGDEEVERTGTRLLELMHMKIERNAFGRQRESFEADVDIKGFAKPFRAVFIRAPVITRVWGDCRIMARLEDKIVMAMEGKALAISFHPELTNDTRIHRMFLEMI